MKCALIVSFIVFGVASGCAVNSTKSNDNTVPPQSSKATVNDVVGAIQGTGQGVVVLQQGNAEDRAASKAKKLPAKTEDSKLAAYSCPPGQLMATKIVTGETGTRITEECVTPFSSNIAKTLKKRARAVAVKLR